MSTPTEIFLELAAGMRRMAKLNCERDGDLLPTVVLMARSGKVSIIGLPDMAVTPEAKVVHADIIRQAAREHQADGVILVAMATFIEFKTPNMSLEDVVNAKERGEGARSEVIAVDFQHREIGIRSWKAPVVRDAHGHALVGAWEEMKLDAVTQYGTFAHLLPEDA